MYHKWFQEENKTIEAVNLSFLEELQILGKENKIDSQVPLRRSPRKHTSTTSPTAKMTIGNNVSNFICPSMLILQLRLYFMHIFSSFSLQIKGCQKVIL